MTTRAPAPSGSLTANDARSEWQQDKPLYKAALRFVAEVGEEGIKALVPGGELLVKLVKSTLDFSDAADEAAFEESMRDLILIGAKTQEEVKGLAALAELMLMRQDEILALMDRTSLSVETPELDELAAQTALRAYFEGQALWRDTNTGWCETVISTERGRASVAEIMVTMRQSRGVLIKGGSGLGKSVLSHSIITQLSDEKIPFIEIMAKYFSGDLETLADRFLQSIGLTGADTFRRCCRTLDLPTILLIDGANECPAEHGRKLAQEIDAMVNTHGVVPLLTSQTPCDFLLTPLEVYEISAPSIEEKRLIASTHGPFGREAEDLLRLARTGLEASLVGKLATQEPKLDSRADIFSRYVDERLGRDATGIEARDVLGRLASVMHERLALVAPHAELKRLIVERSQPGAIEARSQRSGLLEKSFGSVSFSHELWKDFFAGEALLLNQADPQAFGAEISREINAELLPFALGLASERHAEDGVAGLGTAALLHCLLGNCGSAARLAAASRCERALTHLSDVVPSIDFDWSSGSDDWRGALVVPDHVQPFDLCALESAGYDFCRSKDGIDRMLGIIGSIDQRIEKHRRQRRMADSRLPWSVAFAQIYLGFATPAPFRAMIQFAENLRSRSRVSSLPLADYLPPMDVVETAIKLLERDTLSFGQYYLLLKIVNLAGASDLAPNMQHDLALILIRLMRQLWQKLPYHLQLEFFDSFRWAVFRGDKNDHVVRAARQLCEEILPNARPWMVGDIWECLDALGGVVHHDADWDRIERQIQAILKSEPSEHVYREAHGAWIQQMDGPYQREYNEAICSLSEEQRCDLEDLAFMSLEEVGWFDSILIERAVTVPRPEFEPVFRRLARPPIKAVFVQDATRAFLLAVIGLKRVGAEMPMADSQSGLVAAWWAVARIICELSNESGPNEERVRQDWSCLCGPLIDDVFKPIRDVFRAETFDREYGTLKISTMRKYSTELRQIARHHLSKAQSDPNKQNWERQDCLGTAIELIKAYGEMEDVDLLRRFVDDATCARVAIDAIKALQIRGAGG